MGSLRPKKKLGIDDEVVKGQSKAGVITLNRKRIEDKKI